MALWSGIVADSIALIGFGLDSVIELIAAAALLWRLSVEAQGADRERVEASERAVHRIIGITFLLLALYVTAEAGWGLWRREAAAESLVGIILAVASLVVMPLVAWGKLRAARRAGQPRPRRRSEGDPGLLLPVLDPAPGPRAQCRPRLVVGRSGCGTRNGAVAHSRGPRRGPGGSLGGRRRMSPGREETAQCGASRAAMEAWRRVWVKPLPCRRGPTSGRRAQGTRRQSR